MTFAIAANIRKATSADAFRNPKKPPRSVPKALWVAIATQEALLARVRPSLVMGTCARKDVCTVRWKAWKRVLETDPRYSVFSLAKICGYNHATILRALKIMRAQANVVKVIEATSRTA